VRATGRWLGRAGERLGCGARARGELGLAAAEHQPKKRGARGSRLGRERGGKKAAARPRARGFFSYFPIFLFLTLATY
jgi:hypothetical protein